MRDEFYMHLALDEAWKYQLLTYPNPAVGAALLDRCGRLISVAAHRKAGDPHAEINAFFDGFCKLCPDETKIAQLRKLTASEKICGFLRDNHDHLFASASLFVTLEPCAKAGRTPACAPLIADLGVRRVVIGSDDPNPKMAGGGEYLRDRGIAIIRGVLPKECDALLTPFKIWLSRAFVLLKWAQRLNGTIDEGRISGDLALDEVHALRSLCDLIVVGGGTVRQDRPILDARRVGGRAPNALVISRRGSFDRTIPLFNVPDRNVSIAEKLDADSGFILIEGGAGLLNRLADRIDWILCYESFALNGGRLTAASFHKTAFLHGGAIGGDMKIWLDLEHRRGISA
ncbi:MAG: bifunctional diaminohydroxyphosphoribosylaminopyrimidine deaminase/5-amino-6-(5-phosphoribosylamino)uracil reductase RibD [Helicobacteraceae bacterium]|jgi:diaminohydroxyphosphoribosylaminopyrimidine deaminase/5-amino-6-(5-phosphoribosylamino)uracil reductase|nr:bifunctional diaminohydroxyphosphoribosylaminopyrimidine deaminase/5-amino-6-(5-phosphoribosylamino)uracil reductase RibD [Helicobacteraceae bacterium]